MAQTAQNLRKQWQNIVNSIACDTKPQKSKKAADERFLNNDKWRRPFRKLLLANLN